MRLFCSSPGFLLFLHQVFKSLYFGLVAWGGKKFCQDRVCRVAIRFGDKGKVKATRCTWEELKFRDLQQQHNATTLLHWEACEPGAAIWWTHQPHLAKGHSTALGTPQLSDVYSIRPDRSSPPVRWCDFVLERSILHTILTVFIHSFIHLCVFCPRLQWNQSCDIFSSEEFKWELLSVPIFPLSK